MPKAPCKDCEERHYNCHSTCEEYKTYVEENKKMHKHLKDKKEQLNASLYKQRQRYGKKYY